MKQAILTTIALVIQVASSKSKQAFCTPDNSTCWPTPNDIEQFRLQLEPNLPRNLIWLGNDSPRVSAVPIYSPKEQPLYGQNQNMSALYIRTESDDKGICFENNFATLFCTQSVRNNPLSMEPAMVAWPTKPEHVTAAVQFANKHNLCLSVAGTGHDFLNRHSCENYPGLFIRTALMKDVQISLEDGRGPGGTATFGAGIVFSEAQYHASKYERYIASGWATTVGIVGWTLGGGHGPFSGQAGLGVDNLVEAQLVLANGTVVIANSSWNSDLWWALRGGGGSTWGIILSLTLRLHHSPCGGFTTLSHSGLINFCNASKISRLINSHFNWSHGLTKLWSGLMFLTPTKSNDDSNCGGHISYDTLFIYHGGADRSFNISASALQAAVTQYLEPSNRTIASATYASSWSYMSTKDLEPIIPVKWGTSGLQSVLVHQEKISQGRLTNAIVELLKKCPVTGQCWRQEFYDDITGKSDSPRPRDVSISPAFRKATLHVISTGWSIKDFSPMLALGESSYFAESDITVDNWANRYWGSNYNRLQRIKAKYDPSARFGCPRCVE